MAEDTRSVIAQIQSRAVGYTGKELSPAEMATEFAKWPIEDRVKTLEDIADCASDDLVGWTEGDVAKPGFLSGFEVSRAQADSMILDARVRAGWIEAPTSEPEPEVQDAEGA